MHDFFLNPNRDQGHFPPGTWEWQTKGHQQREVDRRLASGERDPWLINEAKRLGIPVPGQRR